MEDANANLRETFDTHGRAIARILVEMEFIDRITTEQFLHLAWGLPVFLIDHRGRTELLTEAADAVLRRQRALGGEPEATTLERRATYRATTDVLRRAGYPFRRR